MDHDQIVLAGKRFEVMLVIVVDKIGNQEYQAAAAKHIQCDQNSVGYVGFGRLRNKFVKFRNEAVTMLHTVGRPYVPFIPVRKAKQTYPARFLNG
ncbi:hypothetical protein D3C86_1751290 [compost metagenome]